MTPDEDRIAQLFDAYNGRAFDRCVAMLTDDVEWPNEVESGVLKGREAVRAYFTEITAPLRARYELISLHTGAEGQVSALSRQVVASAADGSLWSSTRVLHRFTLLGDRIARMQAEQDVQAVTFPGIADLLARLHTAINMRDLDAIVACYAPNAHFADTFESGEVKGLDDVRSHFAHLLDTVRLKLVVLSHALEPDDRVRARVQVETRGTSGGLWQDDTITIWYRLERGLIVDQDVDDSGRDENAP